MTEPRLDWTAQQKLEIVLAGMRGDRSVRDVCREHATRAGGERQGFSFHRPEVGQDALTRLLYAEQTHRGPRLYHR